jgi:hypothetical protein
VAQEKPEEQKMVAVQLMCDEGAFICNIIESDVARMSCREPGVFVVMHHAIRLDATFDGLYEIHRTKAIETSSVDFCQPFNKRPRV